MKSAPEKTTDYKELEEKFRILASSNNLSVYVPNPYFSQNPKFCLIGLEPKIFEDKLQHKIEFLNSITNFLLHYCFYHFLCDKNFDYHFTDISKRPLKALVANKKNGRDYLNWYPLLNEEIKLFKLAPNSLYIITTKSTAKLLKNNVNFKIDNENILHWSPINNGRFEKYFKLSENNNVEFNYIFDKIKSFAIDLMDYLKFSDKAKNERMTFFSLDKISEKSKNQLYYRFFYYKTEFEKISDYRILKNTKSDEYPDVIL